VNTHALLEDLRSQDVRLRVDRGRLVVNPTVGVITDEIRTTQTKETKKEERSEAKGA
jgi:hypothetical protein